MWIVFANPSGWPDHMRVRDQATWLKRSHKLKSNGHEITELGRFGTVAETWKFMLQCQQNYKDERRARYER